MKSKSVELKVAESMQEDIDKGIARMPSEKMKQMGIVSGDLIEIKSKNLVIVRAMRTLEDNLDEEIIRLDGTIRSNINSSIGEKVIVSKAEATPAKVLTLSPLQEGIRFSDNPTEYFHSKLLDKPLVLNQRIVIDVFGTRLNYIVSKLNPKGNTIIAPSTKIMHSYFNS